jgi:hypothetical protein
MVRERARFRTRIFLESVATSLGCAVLSAQSFSEVLATVGDMEADEYSRKVQEAAELRAFWRAQQDRTIRKEYDLSDPDALRKVTVLNEV